MSLVLSVDHRAIDGALAAQWLGALVTSHRATAAPSGLSRPEVSEPLREMVGQAINA